ncbi:MAG: DNA internalization-related competence protein ComEC/Rec2 [Eubacteriales bacterium]|nr:DNA internalization-related competence protein ComEC/Rec2 [Eubacteriales bacterium]
MRQRPVACLALLVFLVLLLCPAGWFYDPPRITEKCDAEITGQVGRRTWKNDKLQLDLEHCRIRTEETEFTADRLLIYLNSLTECPAGAYLSLSGTIYPLTESTNPGQFDSRLYYEGKGISYTVYADGAALLGTEPRPVREGLMRLRARIGEVYDQVLEERDSGILKAMVLGDKADLDEETEDLYRQNGISHLLAISGLHVSLVGMGMYRLLKKLLGFRLAAGIPTILLLAAYSWMTGASVSSVRAACMCALAVLADLAGRTYDMLTAMGTAALGLMLQNPLCVRQSAFLLSFGAVLGIALAGPLWRLLREKRGKLSDSLSVSLSVLLATFPLLLFFFSEYALYSTLLNLLVIPLMSVLMACGLLCGLAGFFWLPAARLPAIPCSLILSVYKALGERCLTLPGAVLRTGSPAVWKIAAYYAALTAVFLLFYREKRRKKYRRQGTTYRLPRKLAAGCAGLLLAAAALLCVRVRTGLTVTVLDVGQGDAVFLELYDGTTFLCDGGSTSVSKVGTWRILPFLKAEGIQQVDYLMLSHMDQDHINGIRELLEGEKIRVGHALLPGLAAWDEAYEEMASLLAGAGIPILCLNTGDRLESEEIALTCLWPREGARSGDRNELSLVMEVEYGEFRMLLTGDIGESAERELCGLGLLEPVDVLKTAHHGSRYSSTAAFLKAVRPSVSVISCSASNRYGHPGEETLERLAAAGSAVRVTMDCGAVRVWTDGEKVRVRGFLE